MINQQLISKSEKLKVILISRSVVMIRIIML